MTKSQKNTPLVLAALTLQLSIIPMQLNAFRAPDIQKDVQNMKVQKKDYIESLALTNVSKTNLKKHVGTNTVLSVKTMVQSIFNKGMSAQLQAGATASLATIQKNQTDNLGFKHIRVTQEYKGIPVVGSEIIVHINNKEDIYMINGKYQSSLNIDIVPTISETDALSIGTDEQVNKENIRISVKPSLVIYNAKLTWFYILEHDGREPGKWYYYIDAKNGKKLNYYNNIKYAAPSQGSGSAENITGGRLDGEDGSNVTIEGFKETSGNYFLYSFDHVWGIYDTDASDWEQQTGSNNWGTSDRAAVSCAKNFEDTQNYVSTVLGRNSFDDNGAFARADIHVDDNYVNAYWDGSKFNFGDGDGSTATALTILDVSAHEYGHAITQYTSNLVYQDESGALNEAYSDILGTAVEFAKQSSGTGAYPNAQAGKSDWLIGEDCWVSDVALRDMKDPQRFGQPSYYHGTKWYSGTGDHGGVHTNSGVANFAYYLLAEGGSGNNDGHSYTITGIGKVEAAAVALRANYHYHTSTSNYEDARIAWIQAATDLGYNTQTVADVWTACGVGVPPPPTYTILDVSGEWTSSSPDARHRPGHYAGYYTFTLTETTPVIIDLESTTDTYMYLLDASDNAIEEDDDGGEGINSKITRTLNAGTYTIEATTYDSDKLGIFTVKAVGEGTRSKATLVPVIMYLLN